MKDKVIINCEIYYNNISTKSKYRYKYTLSNYIKDNYMIILSRDMICDIFNSLDYTSEEILVDKKVSEKILRNIDKKLDSLNVTDDTDEYDKFLHIVLFKLKERIIENGIKIITNDYRIELKR